MNKLFKIITSACAAVVAAASCATGITLAVVTQDNSSSGTLSTAGLTLNAKASNVRVFSAVPAPSADAEGVFEDEKGNKYVYRQSTVQGGTTVKFDHDGGSVSFTEKDITISGMIPGDKVEFDIDVTSTSTISFNYRAELYVDYSEGEDLIDALEFSAGELGLYRTETDDDDTELDIPAVNDTAAILTDYTTWTTLPGHQSAVEHVHVSVALPMTATTGEDQTVTIKYVASGVQNPENLPDVAQVGEGEDAVLFKSVADAVEHATSVGANEIQIIGSTSLEEGTVVIDRALTFNGVKDEDGNLPKIKGARIIVTDGASAEFNDIAFCGAGYIDVSRATSLIMNRCKANVTGVRYFDGAERNYLSDAAFIVSGNYHSPVRLDIADCTIATKGGAAVCMRNMLDDMTVFYNNKFGDGKSIYGGTAAVVLAGVEAGADVRVINNTFYAKNAVSLGSRVRGGFASHFMVTSGNNKAVGATALYCGTSDGGVSDSGSTVDGNPVTIAQMKGALMFAGVDVEYDGGVNFETGNITAGKFDIAEANIDEFYTVYVAKGSLKKNVIVLYRDGAPYAYLNSANNDAGYTVDQIA